MKQSARLARETLNEKQLWTYYGGKIDLDKPLPLATWGDRIIRAHHIRAWIRELEIVLLEAARDFEQIEKHKKIVSIRLRNQPVIQCRIGNEEMPDEEIAENIQTVVRRLETKLKRGIKNFKTVYLKTSMGESVKVAM